MPTTSHIHVRPLEIGDFYFVRDLASKQRNFTIPPMYVLWLLIRIKGSICLIAEHSSEGPRAYLLAVPVEGSVDSVFVWQLAASKGHGREKATSALLVEFRNIVEECAVRNIAFSSVPNSPSFRTIRRVAWEVFSSEPKATSALPPSVGKEESEFLLNLSDTRKPLKSRRLG
jgi:hypothetical protein